MGKEEERKAMKEGDRKDLSSQRAPKRSPRPKKGLKLDTGSDIGITSTAAVGSIDSASCSQFEDVLEDVSAEVVDAACATSPRIPALKRGRGRGNKDHAQRSKVKIPRGEKKEEPKEVKDATSEEEGVSAEVVDTACATS